MTLEAKRVEELTVEDLRRFPVWKFVKGEALGETVLRPIETLPAQNLAGCVVGTEVRLANGATAWALIGNVDVTNPRLTRHVLTLSVFRDGRRFTMARHHDVDVGTRGPQALADFLGLEIDDVFPISYDLRAHCVGDPDAVAGTIEKEPRERLTREQVRALAVR
jgi:hypothetical protein